MECGETRLVNLFDYEVNSNSLAFGKVEMTYQGGDLFTIDPNRFDFEYRSGASFGRNAGTFLGGLTVGQTFTIPAYPMSIVRDILGFGGSFDVIFHGAVTIPK